MPEDVKRSVFIKPEARVKIIFFLDRRWMLATTVMAWLLTSLLSLAASETVGAQESNFSQRAGFAAWRERQRSQARVADARERVLLNRYRPRFMLPPNHPGPIDFYADYMASGQLQLGDGRLLDAPIDAETLNTHRRDPYATFVHIAPAASSTDIPAVIYARTDRLPVSAQGQTQSMTVLTWHAVFRHSGLPAGVEGLRALLASAVGDLHDWHQLDHYTAVSLILGAQRQPVALAMQQHNYMRTFLLGEQILLPPDGRAIIDVAVRSNELFPAQAGGQWRRAVRFADADGMRYLLGFGPQPTMAARDFTHGVAEARYELEFLRTDDAFYSFQGFLGERRLLPGRDGPPGAGYNIVPGLKPLELQLFAGYWREDSKGDLQRYEQFAVRGGSRRAFAQAQREVFLKNLDCLRRNGKVCL
ncbi:MAG: hypothetical protein ACI9DC_001047 [Gammaproteobacteria bacterium]|jgi:hypothetical protein